MQDNEVIASREYLNEACEPPEKVTIRLGLPRRRASDGRYDCGAEIREGGRIWVRYMNGEDALEALQLALAMIGTDLKHIGEQVGGRLTWFAGKRRDLALPTYPDFSIAVSEPSATDGAPDE